MESNIWGILSKQQVKEHLKTSISYAIKNGYEFSFLEGLCRSKNIEFSELIINHCLDIYNDFCYQCEDIYNPKYVSLWKTSLDILYNKLK